MLTSMKTKGLHHYLRLIAVVLMICLAITLFPHPISYAEGEKPKASRTPVFPSGWQNQFGLPFYEHRQSMQVNIFDGYAIYAIKDNSTKHTEPVSDDNGADSVLSLPSEATLIGGGENG